jgi:hypothetical protein
MPTARSSNARAAASAGKTVREIRGQRGLGREPQQARAIPPQRAERERIAEDAIGPHERDGAETLDRAARCEYGHAESAEGAGDVVADDREGRAVESLGRHIA